jgi:DNA repair exonuclease SbcCD ATPase subunit
MWYYYIQFEKEAKDYDNQTISMLYEKAISSIKNEKAIYRFGESWREFEYERGNIDTLNYCLIILKSFNENINNSKNFNLKKNDIKKINKNGKNNDFKKINEKIQKNNKKINEKNNDDKKIEKNYKKIEKNNKNNEKIEKNNEKIEKNNKKIEKNNENQKEIKENQKEIKENYKKKYNNLSGPGNEELTLFISNLPKTNFDENNLKKIFEDKLCQIKEIRIIKNKGNLFFFLIKGKKLNKFYFIQKVFIN